MSHRHDDDDDTPAHDNPDRVVVPGRYYQRDVTGGPIRPADPGPPDIVVARRVADFPIGRVPRGPIEACTLCGAAIVTHPNNPHPDRPLLCLQCAGIQPLPIVDES